MKGGNSRREKTGGREVRNWRWQRGDRACVWVRVRARVSSPQKKKGAVFFGGKGKKCPPASCVVKRATPSSLLLELSLKKRSSSLFPVLQSFIKATRCPFALQFWREKRCPGPLTPCQDRIRKETTKAQGSLSAPPPPPPPSFFPPQGTWPRSHMIHFFFNETMSKHSDHML